LTDKLIHYEFAWLLLPVEKGMCKYESLLDGTINVVDIYRMNHHLTVQELNKLIAQEHGK